VSLKLYDPYVYIRCFAQELKTFSSYYYDIYLADEFCIHTHTHDEMYSPRVAVGCAQKRRLRNKLKTIAFEGVIYIYMYVGIVYIMYIYVYI